MGDLCAFYGNLFGQKTVFIAELAMQHRYDWRDQEGQKYEILNVQILFLQWHK
jgi:hypothetical protein